MGETYVFLNVFHENVGKENVFQNRMCVCGGGTKEWRRKGVARGRGGGRRRVACAVSGVEHDSLTPDPPLFNVEVARKELAAEISFGSKFKFVREKSD